MSMSPQFSIKTDPRCQNLYLGTYVDVPCLIVATKHGTKIQNVSRYQMMLHAVS